jgi:hypothetical protein
MKPQNLERIDNAMFESLDPQQLTRRAGGNLTPNPSITITMVNSVTDFLKDHQGDLPTN